MRLKISIAFMLCFMAPMAVAEHEYIASVLEIPEINRGYVTLNYSYFSESLDVFGYASKLNSTFKPKEASSVYGGFGFKPMDSLLVSYQREQSNASTVRDREPFEVTSDVEGDSLLVHWQIKDVLDFSTQLQFGYTARNQAELDIACYEYSGLVVGSCEGADLSFIDPATGLTGPAVSSSAKETRWLLGVFLKKDINERFSLSHRLRFTSSDVEIETSSLFLDLDDPFLLGLKFNGETLGSTISTLKATFPQEQPWTERVLRYDLGLKYELTEKVFVSGSFGYLTVSRSGFERYDGVPEYESNILLNGAVWYNPGGGLAVYARAELTKNYLLGMDAMLYNQRTAKFFEHPYAQLTAGLFYAF